MFVNLTKSYPILDPKNPDSIVANYDGDSITLKTHQAEQPPIASGQGSSGIQSSAKRAAANALKRI